MKYRARFLVCPLIGKFSYEEKEFEELSDSEAWITVETLCKKIAEEFNKKYHPAWAPNVYFESLLRIKQEEVVVEIISSFIEERVFVYDFSI